MHLLAISGLHVGIVLAICYGGLKWFGVSRERAALVNGLLTVAHHPPRGTRVRLEVPVRHGE